MHADELHLAVNKVVEILERTDIRAVLDQYRGAKGDQRTAAAAKLGHAGAVLMERINALSPAEHQVLKCLHLDSLGSNAYWQNLLGGANDPKKHQGEIVRLASRIMFASSQLPGMVNLLNSVSPNTALPNQPAALPASHVPALESGEGRLNIRLTDAGERASDPDRVARAIDGIDMMYSACASIARKPAMDLRIDGVHAKPDRDRDLNFTGERDGIAATHAVIDSIPAALANIDPEQDIDLDAIVRSLPIFKDLNTLAALGTFSPKELKDISDTMHQGALLTLESGVILLSPDTSATRFNAGRQAQAHTNKQTASGNPVKATTIVAAVEAANGAVASAGQADGSAIEQDEHYARYLREREAMLTPQSPMLAPQPPAGDTPASSAQQETMVPLTSDEALPSAELPSTPLSEDTVANGQASTSEAQNKVDSLLKALGESRSS